MKRSIGDLNGPWAVLLKVFLASWPVVLSCTIWFAVWCVQSIHSLDLRQAKTESWQAIGPRFTAVDANLLKAEIKEWHNQDLDRRQHQ